MTNQEKLLELLVSMHPDYDVSVYNSDHTVIAIRPFGDDVDESVIPFFEFDEFGDLCAVGAYKE